MEWQPEGTGRRAYGLQLVLWAIWRGRNQARFSDKEVSIEH